MSTEAVYRSLKARLHDVVPDVELREKAVLVEEIQRLKREMPAVILGHNYMEPALFHSIPDFVGDSLELCRKAAAADCDTIVFCGVRFMAETAKLLNPAKTVLLPSLRAGCSLAESITAADVRELRARFPGLPVVAYINTSAAVKAEADICCTSGNARAVVESLRSTSVIFVPDEYLARNLARETGKRIIIPARNPEPARAAETDAQLVGWPGRCEVHEQFTVEDIGAIRRQFPDALVLAHPECSPEVVAAADFAGSTTAMIRQVERTRAPHYLLLTECAMGDNIMAANPGKQVLRLCSVRCPHMNQISLEQTREALRLGRYAIDIPDAIQGPASRAVLRMMALEAKD